MSWTLGGTLEVRARARRPDNGYNPEIDGGFTIVRVATCSSLLWRGLAPPDCGIATQQPSSTVRRLLGRTSSIIGGMAMINDACSP